MADIIDIDNWIWQYWYWKLLVGTRYSRY